MTDKLNEAITTIKSGNKETGKQLLMEVLQAEPENDTAWVWMSAVVETDTLRRECLQEALMYNPFNETAQRGLAKINERQPKPPGNGNAREPTPATVSNPAHQENWAYKKPALKPLPQPDEFKHEHAGQDNATTYTIKELARFTKKETIASNLAVTGMDYETALKFVGEIEVSKRREVELRRLPLVIALCTTLTFMGGVWTFSIIWSINNNAVPSIWAFVFGIPMFFSGVAGLINTVYKITKG